MDKQTEKYCYIYDSNTSYRLFQQEMVKFILLQSSSFCSVKHFKIFKLIGSSIICMSPKCNRITHSCHSSESISETTYNISQKKKHLSSIKYTQTDIVILDHKRSMSHCREMERMLMQNMTWKSVCLSLCSYDQPWKNKSKEKELLWLKRYSKRTWNDSSLVEKLDKNQNF